MDFIYKRPKNRIIRFLGGALRHLRRLFYSKFRLKHVKQSIAKRKGYCKHCGCCRDMVIKCPHLKDDKDCAKYPDFPAACKDYPFDEKDKNWFSREHCGFYWD